MGGVLDFIKGLFVERDGSMKWGSLLTIGLGALLGGWFGGGTIGALLGGIVGAVASPMLDNFFRRMGLNPPTVTSSPYPTTAPALQPTQQLAVSVEQPDRTQTRNAVQSPILENLRAPSMTMQEADRLRERNASLNIAISNGRPHNPAEAHKLETLEHQLKESQFKLLQFNQTFDKYAADRAAYYRAGGERERLVNDMVKAGLSTEQAKQFVPDLPDPQEAEAVRPKMVGYVYNRHREARALTDNYHNEATLRKSWNRDGLAKMTNLQEQLEAEWDKRAAGQNSRILSMGQFQNNIGIPQDDKPYFVAWQDNNLRTTGLYTVHVQERYRMMDARSNPLSAAVPPEVDEYGKAHFLGTAGNTESAWKAMSDAQRLNVALQANEEERRAFETGNMRVNWSKLPKPLPQDHKKVVIMPWNISRALDRAHHGCEADDVRILRGILEPADGKRPTAANASLLRETALRARGRALEREKSLMDRIIDSTVGQTGIVDQNPTTEYDKILRYADVLERRAKINRLFEQVSYMTRQRAQFCERQLTQAEAQAHDFVQHRLPIFNATGIAIMEHGECESGYFISFQDTKAANTGVTTVVASPAPDGKMKLTLAPDGNDAGDPTPERSVTIDAAVIEALKARDGQINPAALTDALRMTAGTTNSLTTSSPQRSPSVATAAATARDAVSPSVAATVATASQGTQSSSETVPEIINRALNSMATPADGSRRIALTPVERALLTSAAADVITSNPVLVTEGRHAELAAVITDRLTQPGSQTNSVLIGAARRELSSGVNMLASDAQIRDGVRAELQPFTARMLATNSATLRTALSALNPGGYTTSASTALEGSTLALTEPDHGGIPHIRGPQQRHSQRSSNS